jgi:hypothetical protein
LVGHNAGLALATSNSDNVFVGQGSGGSITTGDANVIIGRYSGNAGGLDIRTSSNNIVLSDGDGNPRVHINSSGYMGVGEVSPAKRFMVKGGNVTTANFYYTDASDVSLMQIRHARAGYSSNTATMIQFQNTSGTEVGTIKSGLSSTNYNTSSDYRLKENVDYTWDATTRLKQLKPARFNFIADADTTVDGFLAHEVQSVVPEAISGTKDEVDADGNAVMQGIDQAKLVPLLVKTIQELEARITALEGA